MAEAWSIDSVGDFLNRICIAGMVINIINTTEFHIFLRDYIFYLKSLKSLVAKNDEMTEYVIQM